MDEHGKKLTKKQQAAAKKKAEAERTKQDQDEGTRIEAKVGSPDVCAATLLALLHNMCLMRLQMLLKSIHAGDRQETWCMRACPFKRPRGSMLSCTLHALCHAMLQRPTEATNLESGSALQY